MTAITVYGTPNCVQCTSTVRTFERKGLEEGRDFTYVDLSTDPGAYAYVTGELKYERAPVVVLSEHDHWSGMHPDNNKRAVAIALAAREPAVDVEAVTAQQSVAAAPAQRLDSATALREAQERVRVARQQPVTMATASSTFDRSTYHPTPAAARGLHL